MADRIIEVQTITVTNTAEEISLPRLWDPSAANAGSWGQGHLQQGSQYHSSDKIVYVFDNFTGSFELIQEDTETEGITIRDEVGSQVQSGPWRLIAKPPRFLINSGSNSQAVKVSIILVR